MTRLETTKTTISIAPNTKVECNKYDSASIDEVFFTIAKPNFLAMDFEKALIRASEVDKKYPKLAKYAGIIYSIENSNGGVLHIQCCDDYIYIGNGIRINK